METSWRWHRPRCSRRSSEAAWRRAATSTREATSYHLFSPLLVGISDAADSLYAIEELVYRRRAFTLDELRTCLVTNWGKFPPAIGRFVSLDRMQSIRQLCREQPKFGSGIKAVDEIAWKLIDMFVTCVDESIRDEIHQEGFDRLRERYHLPGHTFELNFAPGAGTFKQYVLLGGLSGASSDGRSARDPIASDLSPAPTPADEPATDPSTGNHKRMFRMAGGLRSYEHACIDLLGDGAAADYNIPESFPQHELVKALERFSQGKGPSVATFTASNPETFAQAVSDPENFDLVRVRMGGWTEFFVTLFPIHQAQHQRRPLYVP